MNSGIRSALMALFIAAAIPLPPPRLTEFTNPEKPSWCYTRPDKCEGLYPYDPLGQPRAGRFGVMKWKDQ